MGAGGYFACGRMGMVSPAGGTGDRMFRLRASDFLCGQKVTKEPSKGRGISIFLSPLKSPLLKTTNLVLADVISFALP